MNLLLPLFVIQVVWGQEWNFYHERSREIFLPPTTLREDSYFGFSTTYDRYNKRLIISAPRETDIGEVYECGLSDTTRNSCSKVYKNFTREEAPLYKNDYWFGAVVESGPSYVMACAPRYVRRASENGVTGTHGRCYKRNKDETFFSSPMFPKPVSGGHKNQHEETRMDTLGWSLAIGDGDTMIVGGPGLFDKTGIAALCTLQKKLLKRISIVEKHTFNFGYSVAVGYFTNENSLTYAVSTTYGTDGAGQVYFYNDYNDLNPIALNKTVDKGAIGTMFGAVLCKAKLNSTGKGNDLLVGAPTYAMNSGYNTGAVYVYIYHKKGAIPKYHRTIIGRSHSSWFGNAIISVGDINNDKRDDIAIGAPFEDEGVVYLYSGAAILRGPYHDRTFTWLQRITPTGKKYASFGYSLAALQDYDNNGCNELAVSAPYNDTVMLYKCLAAVTVTKLYAHFPNVKNRTQLRKTDFVFQVCMDLQYPDKPKNIVGELSTDVKMNHLYAKLKTPNTGDVYTFKVPLQIKNKTYCEFIDFILPLDKDYSIEIGYDITTKQVNSPINMDYVTGDRIVLSDNSELTYSGAFWAAECAGADECISNLSLTISSDLKDLVIGSRDKGTFNINVLNTGEVAYDPCIQFSIKGANLQIPPLYCTKDKYLEETWKCITIKPVKTNDTWKIENIVVDLRGLTNLDDEVSLNVKLFDQCADVSNSRDYEQSFTLKSSSEGIFIKGTTDVGDTFSISKDDLSSSKHLEQIYTIMNKGPTNFKRLTSTVKLQKTEFVTYPAAAVSIHLETTYQLKGIHEICRVTTNTDIEMIVTCPIERLYKDEYVRVHVSMDTNPLFLTYDVLKNQDNVKVTSSLSITKLMDKPKSLTTLISLREAFVDIWILILAGLVGILLIIILAVVLYKYGFLQRKNKEKLDDLKKDIRRQTVRQSRMPPDAGDRKTILDNMEVADEAALSSPNPAQAETQPPANEKK